MHHDEPLFVPFVASITLEELHSNESNDTPSIVLCSGSKYNVFDQYVGVGLPLVVDILSCCSRTIDLLDRAHQCQPFVGRLFSSLCQMVAHGLLQNDPMKNNTAILGHAEHD
jgi:hypothetical protein